jgi:hypothetical protein
LGQLSKSAYQFNQSQQNHFYKTLAKEQQQQLEATEALSTSLVDIPLRNVQTAP